jgi:NAD(P)H-flavin reductase
MLSLATRSHGLTHRQSLGGAARTHVFLCGPPVMIDALCEPLRALKLRGVHCEKWW